MCRSVDVSTFYVPDEASGGERRRREVEAKDICTRCPVRPQCAAHALATREQHGIWGGFTEAERRLLLAIGWQDLADRHRRRVDIAGLAARLWTQHRPPDPVPAPIAVAAHRPMVRGRPLRSDRAPMPSVQRPKPLGAARRHG
jgi:WhiB family redox-sensing transcriptional regulator